MASAPAASAPVASAPVQTYAAGGGTSPDAVVDSDSAWSAMSECNKLLVRAGAVFRAADSSDANAYRVARAGLWVEVNQAPPGENGATMIPSPASSYKDTLEGLANAGDFAGLINAAEEIMIEAPLWLDPHRYVALALGNLGHDAARTAVLREVGVLLSRAPSLPDLTFNDGTPIADQATKDWIESDVKPILGSGGGGGGGGGPRVSPLEAKMTEARAMVANGALPDAVALVVKASAAAQTPVERLRGKLAVAQLCLQGEQFLVARAQLEGLDKMVERHRLWEWEPVLCAQFYEALYLAHRGMNVALGMDVPPELRAKETLAFERLCQLDPGAALKFTLGS